MNINRLSIIFITIDLSRMISLTNIKHFRSQSSLTFFYPIRINSRGKRSNQKLISSGQFLLTLVIVAFSLIAIQSFFISNIPHTYLLINDDCLASITIICSRLQQKSFQNHLKDLSLTKAIIMSQSTIQKLYIQFLAEDIALQNSDIVNVRRFRFSDHLGIV